eukprot:1161343-Pelagomonas_calceolata.AAC.4
MGAGFRWGMVSCFGYIDQKRQLAGGIGSKKPALVCTTVCNHKTTRASTSILEFASSAQAMVLCLGSIPTSCLSQPVHRFTSWCITLGDFFPHAFPIQSEEEGSAKQQALHFPSEEDGSAEQQAAAPQPPNSAIAAAVAAAKEAAAARASPKPAKASQGECFWALYTDMYVYCLPFCSPTLLLQNIRVNMPEHGMPLAPDICSCHTWAHAGASTHTHTHTHIYTHFFTWASSAEGATVSTTEAAPEGASKPLSPRARLQLTADDGHAFELHR